MSNLRINYLLGQEEPKLIESESHVVPTGSLLRTGQPENEFKLNEVPVPGTVVARGNVGNSSTTNIACIQVFEGQPDTQQGGVAYAQTGRDGLGFHHRFHLIAKLDSLAAHPAVVDRVLLKLFLNDTGPSGRYPEKRSLGVYKLLGAWNESTVTWNNVPAHEIVPRTKFSTTVSGWYNIDITEIYRENKAANENFGVLIKDGFDQDTDTERQFSRDNGSNPPQIHFVASGQAYEEVQRPTAPEAGQFVMNYDFGVPIFHNTDRGKTVLWDYMGRGGLNWE